MRFLDVELMRELIANKEYITDGEIVSLLEFYEKWFLNETSLTMPYDSAYEFAVAYSNATSLEQIEAELEVEYLAVVLSRFKDVMEGSVKDLYDKLISHLKADGVLVLDVEVNKAMYISPIRISNKVSKLRSQKYVIGEIFNGLESKKVGVK